MKIPLGLVLGVVSVHGQSVSNITFDGVGDSSARVIFNVSSSFNAYRLRHGISSCAGGSGGAVQTNGSIPSVFQRIGATGLLSGLAPATQYHVCPEVSSDGGATWSRGADTTFTTLPRTQVLPIPPVPVPTTFPVQSGITRTVGANCEDSGNGLQALINASAPGDTIRVPAGTICTGAYTTPIAPDAKRFAPSDVATSTSTIHVVNHGFADNAEVRVSTNNFGGGCLPGNLIFQAFNACQIGGGWAPGGHYWVHRVDADHVQLLTTAGGSPAIPGWLSFTADATADTITITPTVQTHGGFGTVASGNSIPANTRIQFATTGSLPEGLLPDTTYFLLSACTSNGNTTCSSKVSLTAGGPPVDITSAGTGTQTIVDQGTGLLYIAPAPSALGPWILITTSGNLPPAGTRIDPSWDAQLFHLRNATPIDATPRFLPGILAHNWRFAGVIFDTGTNNDYQTSMDPRPYCGGPSSDMDASYIIFDQVRIQGPGYPNRFGCKSNASNMVINGANIGFINSDMRGFDYWHPWYGSIAGGPERGLTPTRVSATQVTATPGVCHGGIFTTTTTGTTTINFTGGSATGTVYVYCAMDGTIQVLAPTGTTGNCFTTGTTCGFSTTASPNWPATGGITGDRGSGVHVFTVALAEGLVVSTDHADGTTSANPGVIEGCNCIIAGNGPGPYIIDNTYMSGSGLPLHFDDSGGPFRPRGDYTITRNYFNIPASQQVTGPKSDGLWYGNRQPLEWKGGQRIKVDGNTFDGCFDQINPVSVCIAITPRSGGYVTDVDVTNNRFINSAGGVNIGSPIDSVHPSSKPAARQRFSNNLFLLNGWTGTVSGQNPRGWTFYGGFATEDITIDHNTVYDNRGPDSPFLHWTNAPIGGMSITNNIYFFTGSSPMFENENIASCGNVANKAMMDCAFTAGPGIPSYTFSNNVIVPSWNDTSAPAGFVTRDAVNAALGSLVSSNYVPTGGSQAGNLALLKFNTDYTLASNSLYASSCGGRACGFSTAVPTAAIPRIDRVLNGASFVGGPVASGEIAAILGINLGPAKPVSAELAPDGRVSTLSGSVYVLFNGVPAPLLYVSATQINAVVPYEVVDAADLSVTVTYQGRTSDPYALLLTSATPALFTLDGSGTGPAAILNEDNSMNTPTNAAAKGSQIVLYLTGEGQTNPPGITGKITSSTIPPLPPQPLLPVAAIINGSTAPVLFYGETPGQVAGLMQLNVQIPESAPSGDLSLVVAVGIKGSQPGITVSVQ